MKIGKKLKNLAMVGLIGLASLIPFKSKADDKIQDVPIALLEPNQSKIERDIAIPYIQLAVYPGSNKEYFINKSRLNPDTKKIESVGVKDVLKKTPETLGLWYLADVIKAVMHEEGHYDKAIFDLDSKASVDLFFVNGTPIVGGKVRCYNDFDKKDAAELNIAGLVRTGELAENLKQDILFGYNTKKDLKFKSMLALSTELGLPISIYSYYYINNPNNDITNYTKNTGVKPEMMALNSGVHLLLNLPYIYTLARNAVGFVPKDQKLKDINFSFRYDGDRYMLYVYANPGALEKRISELDLNHSFKKIGRK